VGGLFRHVCDLASAQSERGHLVGVICDATSGDRLTDHRLATLVPKLSLGLFRTPMSRELGPRDLLAYRAIRAHALSCRVDVIHGHGAKGGAYSRLTARALKRSGLTLASCYTPHGGSLNYDPASLSGRVYMGMEQQLAHSTDAVIFESAYSAARYAASVGSKVRSACVIPNGLAPHDFAAAENARDAADFLFVGELRRLKGIDVMLEALARVCKKRSVSAVIVGDGPDAACFKQQAEALGLLPIVTFAGAMPARAAFCLGRVLIIPSRAESFPYIVLEAAAASVPFIATSVGGIPEIVSGTDTRLVQPDNPEALADAMLQVLGDPRRAQRSASTLKRVVEGRFTVSAMADAVLGVYTSVLSGTALRASH
jgi:glycosyltransferase involved in cell wall biosynthesis